MLHAEQLHSYQIPLPEVVTLYLKRTQPTFPSAVATSVPSFLFIGPDKTGSSWIHAVLCDHPQCFVPAWKDVYFFDRYYDRGIEWYRALFADAPPHVRVMGELSHDYIISPAAAQRIASDLPGVKLLTSLRDPVERSFSHYLYLVRSGATDASFVEAMTKFPALIDNSRYYKHLSEYFPRFSRRQLGVLFYEELCENPRLFAKQLFDFLELEWCEHIDYERRVRSASRPRNAALARLLKHGANWARSHGCLALVGAVKHGPWVEWLYPAYEQHERPEICDEGREPLLAGLREDSERLRDYLGIEFPAWSTLKGTGE